MNVSDFKPGMFVRIKLDNASGAKVNAGDVGLVKESPDDRRKNRVTVKFDKEVGGYWAPDLAVFYPSELEILWFEDDSWEDRGA